MGYVYTKQFSSHYKPNKQYIGVVGHVDHGKSSLLYSLIEKYCKIKPKFNEVFDTSAEEKDRGITINQRVITIPYKGTEYNFIDFPGHADYVNTVAKGLSHCYAVILVVSATDGVMPQTKEFLYACKQAKVPNLFVYLSKSDVIDDKEYLSLVSSEVLDFVDSYGYKVPYLYTRDSLETLMKDISKIKVSKKASDVIKSDIFEGELYLSTKDEGGRHTPIFSGFQPTFIIGDKAVTGFVVLDKSTDVLKPGESAEVKVKLDKPALIDLTSNILVREQGKTIGKVTNLRK